MHLVELKPPSQTTATDVHDALGGILEGMTDCIVLYERDGEVGWLSTEYDRWSDFIGFIEYAKSLIAHQAQHQGGEE